MRRDPKAARLVDDLVPWDGIAGPGMGLLFLSRAGGSLVLVVLRRDPSKAGAWLQWMPNLSSTLGGDRAWAVPTLLFASEGGSAR